MFPMVCDCRRLLCAALNLLPIAIVSASADAAQSIAVPKHAPAAAMSGVTLPQPGERHFAAAADAKRPGSDRVTAKDAKAAARAARRKRERAAGNLVGHGGPVKAIAINASGTRALSGSFDYAMMLWDLSVSPPRILRRFDQHDGAVNAVAFAPGEKRVLAAGDDGAVSLYDIDSGKRLHLFKGHTAKVLGVNVSADGRWAVTASWDRTVRLWNLQTGASGAILKGHKGPVNAAAFSKDGRQVYTASHDGTIGLWDASTGSYQRPAYKHGWGINVMRRLPGADRLIFGALDGTVGVVDPEAAQLLHRLAKHDRPVLSLDILAKPGLVAVGTGSGIVRVSRLGDWVTLEEHHNPFGPVWALAFLAGGRFLYYAGLDDFVTRWQIKPRALFEVVQSKFPRRFQVTSEMSVGARHFARKCSVCHTLKPDGRNRAGPTLYGIFGRRAGSIPGYPYSPALKTARIIWDEETIGKLFALGPEHYTPGSKMPLQKISDPAERAALIAFLRAASSRQGKVDGGAGKLPGSIKKEQ